MLFLADFLYDLIHPGDDLLIDLMGLVDGLDHDLVADLISSGLDHDDLLPGRSYGQVKGRNQPLYRGGVKYELTVDDAYLSSCTGAVKGNV